MLDDQMTRWGMKRKDKRRRQHRRDVALERRKIARWCSMLVANASLRLSDPIVTVVGIMRHLADYTPLGVAQQLVCAPQESFPESFNDFAGAPSPGQFK